MLLLPWRRSRCQPIAKRTALRDDLEQFLRDARDAREYQRAQAVKLALEGYPYAQIAAIVQGSPSFMSKWKRRSLANGIPVLRLGY